MRETELPRYEDDFRAALDLKCGLVYLCRDAIQADGEIARFDAIRRALSQLGPTGDEDGIHAPAVAAADSLQRIVRFTRISPEARAADPLWSLPVAAGVGGRTVQLDAASRQSQAVEGWLELLEGWLMGSFPVERRSVDMPVLTRLGAHGEVSTLRLRALVDGPRGLYPHPTMALFYGDPGFRDGVANAWTCAVSRTGTITWEIRKGDWALDHVVGGSAGAAFAVALRHLEHQQSRRSARVLGVRGRAAVSAQLKRNGSLDSVAGRDDKLRAAAESRINLVVLAASDRASQTASGVSLEYAANVEQATRLTRGRMSRRSAVVGVSFVAALVIVAVLLVLNHEGALQNRGERLSRVANELLARATTVGEADLPLQQKLELAASSIAMAANDPRLAQSAVSRGATSRPGIIKRLNLALAGSPDGLVAVNDGRDVVAWSESGHVALFDGLTGDEDGTFVQPPGVLSLAQPIPRATSALSGTGLVAFVFQIPARLSTTTNPEASLIILNTEGPLRVVGSVPDFTTTETTAVGYSPSGVRLLTVSDSTVTYWDVSHATPEALDTCHWHPPGVSDEAVQVVSLPGEHPGLVLAHGQIVQLATWEPSGSECRGTLIAPPLPGVSEQNFTNHLIATSDDSRDHFVEYGIRRDGDLAVRPFGGRAKLVTVRERARGVTSASLGQVLLQLGTRSKPSLGLYQTTGASLKAVAQFDASRLPAIAVGDSVFAAENNRIDQLSTQTETYPPGIIELGHSRQVVNGLAMTPDAVAIAYPSDASIIGIRDQKIDRQVTWPTGYKLAPGDGRLNSTFSLSASGRYLATILDSGEGKREVIVFDTRRHTEVAVQPALTRFTTAAPIDVAFEHRGERLLVEYLNGLLVRLTPTGDGWKGQALIRGEVGQEAFGLTLSDSSTFRFEVTRGQARVARYGGNAELESTWSLATTHLTFGLNDNTSEAQLAVMSDSRALLVLDSGTAISLRQGGLLGKPISLGTGPVLDTAQIGDDDLLISREQGTSTLQWQSGVVEDSTSRYGPLDALASSPDFRVLAGSIWLTAQSFITGLRTDAQTATLCEDAEGDLSATAWRYFVGSALSYRPICAALKTQGHELGFLGFRSRLLPQPIDLATPTVGQSSLLAPSCSSSHTTLGWARQSHNEVIVCWHGSPIWVTTSVKDPHVTSGGSKERPLLMISGHPITGEHDDSSVSELIDASGNVAAQFVTRGGTAGLRGTNVAETERVGDLLLTTTYAPDPRGAGWRALQQAPVGTVEPPIHRP